MKQPPGVPSVGELALKYGTINSLQLDQLLAMHKKTMIAFPELMQREKMATKYQISLILMIQEFLILKQEGEKFGQIAVKKGFATKAQVDEALKKQLKQFREEKLKRMIGDILVESGAITIEQKKAVAREQKKLELESPVPWKKKDRPGELNLSDEERHFLSVRNLDKTFAAIVVKKEFATKHQVDSAMETQMKMFKRHRAVNLLGDVMVSEGFLTPGQRNLILAEQKREATPEEPTEPIAPHEGKINITIAQDAMEAWAEILEPQNPPPPLTTLKAAMEKKGVIHGILRDEILQCCLEKKLPRFILARGDLPILSGGTRVKYLFDTSETDTRVERGEPLAELERIGKSIPGRDIFGTPMEKEIPHRKEPFVFNCGKNAKIARDLTKAFAGKSGIPFLSVLGQIHVFPPVNVLDDADMRFGAIETNAALSVSGILTGAYPVRAGTVKAGEIRDTRLESVGDISVSIGITNAVIKTLGSVRARYIHNSTIEAFGDVTVDNEILDSTITISGRCMAPKSRIIASTVSARGGVTAWGVGSDRTEPCHISANREEHLVLELERVETDMDLARQELYKLENSIKEMGDGIDRIFERMVRLKRLHDKARAEKARHKTDSEREAPRTHTLVEALDKKLASAVHSLKTLNRRKKTMEHALENLKKNESIARPQAESKIKTLEQKRFRLLEWNKKSQGLSEITITGPMAQGTLLSGPFSSTLVKAPCHQVTFFETRKKGAVEESELTCKKITPAST